MSDDHRSDNPTTDELLAFLDARPVSLGPLGGLQYRFIGLDPELMQWCGRLERLLQTALAVAVLLTVSLAALYGTISSSIYDTGRTEIHAPHVVVGLMVGGAIYILERVLIATFTRDYRTREASSPARSALSTVGDYVRIAVLALIRFGIALVIAAIVTDPVLLVIYEADVNQVLQARRDAAVIDEITDVQDEMADAIANEVQSSPTMQDAELRIAELQGEQQAATSARSQALAQADRFDQLATCEENGSTTGDCAQLRNPDDPRLSGEITCGTNCETFRAEARAQRTEADRLGARIAAIDQVELPSANRVLQDATAANLKSVEVVLGDDYTAESPVRALLECKETEIRLHYGQLSGDDPRLERLFEFCEMDLDQILDRPLAFSGLQPRQEAFEVLTECKDPLGLRTTEVDQDEPRYCAIVAGKVRSVPAAGETESPTGETEPATGESELVVGAVSTSSSGWDVVRRPLRRLLNAGDSTLAQGSTRLSWLIVALDLLPLFLKLSLTLRNKRPYDAISTLDKDLALQRVDDARLQADRRRPRSPGSTPWPGPRPDPPPTPGAGPVDEDPPGSATTSDRAVIELDDTGLQVLVTERGYAEGSCAFIDRGVVGGKQVVVKRPKPRYEQMAIREAGLVTGFGKEGITPVVYGTRRSEGISVLELYPLGSLDQVLGIGVGSTSIRLDLSVSQLLCILEQIVDFNAVMWKAGYCYLDNHAGNFVVNGTELVPLPTVAMAQEFLPGALKVIDFGTVSPMVGPCSLGRAPYLPPEHGPERAAHPLWDVYGIGCLIETILTRGARPSSAPLRYDTPAVDALARLARTWQSADPKIRVPGWQPVGDSLFDRLRGELRRELADVREVIRTVPGSDTFVLRAGQPAQPFDPNYRFGEA